MKKVALVCATMAVFCTVSLAQASFSVMPKAGVSFGVDRMGLDNYSDTKMKVGFLGGVGFPIAFGDYFEVQPEFNYIQKNSQYNFKSDDGAPVVTTKLFLSQYEIPVLLKAKWERIYVSAGPSFTINGKGRNETNGVKTDFTFGSGTTELKKSVWGMQFGLGYNLELLYGTLNFDARYGLNFTDMDNVVGDKNTSKVDALMVSVGYIIPIGTNGIGTMSEK